MWSKYQTLKVSIISHLYITLFLIYKAGKLTYCTPLVCRNWTFSRILNQGWSEGKKPQSKLNNCCKWRILRKGWNSNFEYKLLFIRPRGQQKPTRKSFSPKWISKKRFEKFPFKSPPIVFRRRRTFLLKRFSRRHSRLKLSENFTLYRPTNLSSSRKRRRRLINIWTKSEARCRSENFYGFCIGWNIPKWNFCRVSPPILHFS